MTLATERKRAGRLPLTIVEMDLDFCDLTFGVSPCTAALRGTGLECYNTRKTCQDPPNYTPSAKTYRFVEDAAGVPITLDAIPALRSVTTAPTRITPGEGLGFRANVTVTMQDFPHHDRAGIDKYLSTRQYTPMEQGTFFGKLRARTPYYAGRPLRVKRGFLVDADIIGSLYVQAAPYTVDNPYNIVIGTEIAFDAANFETRLYIIDKFKGPDANGKITITAKDILTKTDAAKALAPSANTGTLSVAMTTSDTTLTMQTGDGAGYNDPVVTGANEYIRIGSEIIQYTGISTDQLTGLTRATWNTTAATHAIDDGVQQCLAFEAVNVVDVIQTLLTTYAAIPISYIDTTAWATEKTEQLSAFSLTGIISKPEAVNKLVGEMTEQTLCNIWWDERTQKIILKALAPSNQKTQLTDAANFINIVINDVPKQRLSQMWVYYNIVDHVNPGKPESFSSLHVQADTTVESSDLYGEKHVKQVFSRWFTSLGPVNQFASRMITWLKENPRIAEFTLDVKDDLWTGDPIDIVSNALQNADGSPLTTGFLILEAEDKGDTLRVRAINSPFFGRFGVVMADGTADYSGLDVGGWIAPDAAGFSDGGEAFKIS